MLRRDHRSGAYAARVFCMGCGLTLRKSDAIIDVDMEALVVRAHYHAACAPRGPVRRCDVGGCSRDECVNACRTCRSTPCIMT